MVKKVMKEKDALEKARYLYEDISKTSHLSIKKIYNKLRGDYPKVSWRRLICSNSGYPKWIFRLQLTALERPYTRDRLSKWGVITKLIYPLCDNDDESIEHLFFKCHLSAALWDKMLTWMKINRGPMGWNQELAWIVTNANAKDTKAGIYRLTMTGCVYYLWHERNLRIFQKKSRSVEVLSRLITQGVHCRGHWDRKLAGQLRRMNFFP
ncbi:uncharacterized protein [Nicotiana tomentosiformis]|uniref:uncharacterized protein n=1 Tax=Nicotiana tomentosiformis TaxID=4098 RepID=UPI00388C7605